MSGERDLQPFERRGEARVQLKGTVVVQGGERPLLGRIHNVSRGGVLVAVEEASRELIAPLAHHPTQLELRVDSKVATWISLRGEVIRTTPDTLVVRFAQVPEELETMVRAELRASEVSGQSPTIVVVDADATRRAPIARAFAEAGYEVIEAATPLEAIASGSAAIFEPLVFAVADTTPAAIADELRAFLAREHPHAQVITIGHKATVTPVHDWLSSQDPQDDLATRIQRLVRTDRG